MKLLLDAQLLIWAGQDEASVPARAHQFMADPTNFLVFSAVSIWEVAIKTARRPKTFTVDPAQLRLGLLEAGYTELPINSAHLLAAGKLPPIHRDPFDRMLIAQARVEQLLLLTTDEQMAQYPGPVRRV